MKRFLIFAILGPPLGFVTLFWGLLGTLGLALGEPPAIDAGQFVLLPMAYALGLAPARCRARSAPGFPPGCPAGAGARKPPDRPPSQR